MGAGKRGRRSGAACRADDLTGSKKSWGRHSGARRRREPGIQKAGNPDVTGFRARRRSASKTRV